MDDGICPVNQGRRSGLRVVLNISIEITTSLKPVQLHLTTDLILPHDLDTCQVFLFTAIKEGNLGRYFSNPPFGGV